MLAVLCAGVPLLLPAVAPDVAPQAPATAQGRPGQRALAAPGDAAVARPDSILAELDAAWNSGQRAASLEMAARLLPPARARGDSALVCALLIRQGARLAALGDPLAGEIALLEAVRLGEATRDSFALTSAVRWLSVAVGSQGRRDDARDLYLRLYALARAMADRRNEGWALIGLAWDALESGRDGEAERHYRAALERFHAEGDREGEVWAGNGLGIALSHQGRYVDAGASYRAVAAAARASGQVTVEAMALNNVGTIEWGMGDPGEATRHFRRASALQRSIGQVREMLVPDVNLAVAEAALGRHAVADSILTASLHACQVQGYRDLRGMVLREAGDLALRRGRPHEAAALLRRGLAIGDTLPLVTRIKTTVSLAAALSAVDSGGAALETLERARASSPPLHDAPWVELNVARGRCLLEAGRPADAVSLLRAVVDSAALLRLSGQRLLALAHAARAERSLGHNDSALALLERGALTWEHDRGLPLDPRWREERSGSARLIYTELADLLIAPDGAQSAAALGRRSAEAETEAVAVAVAAAAADAVTEAFERVQPFKARTLRERMAGPGAADSAVERITLAALQRDVLREGELLLDAYVGPERSLLFAVTRNACRAVRLPGERLLEERVRLYRGLIATPPVSHDSAALAAVNAAGEQISHLLLHEVSHLIARSRRVFFLADGALNLLPLAALSLPADTSANGPPREWTRVPSVSVLITLRQQSQRSLPPHAPDAPHVMAIAGRVTDGGRPLHGAASEVRWLARTYAGVRSRVLPDGEPFGPNHLLGAQVLHFASHVSLDDEHPWRSAVRLGTGTAGDLTAVTVAGLRLQAQLAVLAGCDTGAGKLISGEGVLGLSGAFLVAGVPAVVATLWAVEDQTAAIWTSRFYEELARGQTAAAALAEAQLALRRDPRTRHPFYWAAFILIGDGTVRAPLAPSRRLF